MNPHPKHRLEAKSKLPHQKKTNQNHKTFPSRTAELSLKHRKNTLKNIPSKTKEDTKSRQHKKQSAKNR